MKSNNDAASVKCCARKIWAHFKEFVVSVKGDLKETHDEMFQGADTPKQRLQRSVKHGLLLLAQLCLIMGVYAAGCALASVLPITLPGNILGMVLLLVLLGTHILKTKYISEACDYLIDNMSVFFMMSLSTPVCPRMSRSKRFMAGSLNPPSTTQLPPIPRFNTPYGFSAFRASERKSVQRFC